MSLKKDEAFTSSDSYNGAVTEKYSWSQTINDIDVKIPVGPEIKKSKDISVKIDSNRILMYLDPQKTNCYLEGKLTAPIIKDESYWNLTPGEAVYLWLQKSKEKWWTALFEDETPIDMTSIEPVRPMEDLAEDEQMKVAELMFNQDQKRKGLPTSDEMKMQDILKKAWDVEGSPFKGMPYDPSMVQLGGNSASPFPADGER